MVVLFSNRKSKSEKEILTILTACGADFISDKSVHTAGGSFTVAVCYKPAELNAKKSIILMLDDTEKFISQTLPISATGICEDCNFYALKVFAANNIPVISCGNSSKNTITLSSISDDCIVATLQREITDINGRKVYPCDIKIKMRKNYSPFAVMSSVAILLLNGIVPTEF